MFEFFRSAVQIVAPVFVVSAMLNVGLTQKLPDIVSHLHRRAFVVKMLVVNFAVAPLLMIAAVSILRLDPALEAGLLIFSVCAGAPFLIKLTQSAQHDVALGAAVMVLLTVVTIIYVPLVLPLILSGVSVDGWAIGKTLLLQMLLPIAAGMSMARLLTRLAATIQPPVGLLANIALYALIVVTLVGYLPNMLEIVGTGAILVGLAFVLAAFGAGYLAGGGKDHLEDIGGLGTAQRNTAAGIIIAIDFEDPDVLVVMTLLNTFGLVMLMFLARFLSRDNEAEAKERTIA